MAKPRHTREILLGLKYLHDRNVYTQVVKGSDHGLASDIWSLGCTALETMTGQFPYHQFDVVQAQALFMIWKSNPLQIPDSISKDARDFILQCLQGNPSSRPTTSELLDHPFVKEKLPSTSEPVSLHNPR